MTDIRGNPFFGGKSLFPLAKRDFLSSENYFGNSLSQLWK